MSFHPKVVGMTRDGYSSPSSSSSSSSSSSRRGDFPSPFFWQRRTHRIHIATARWSISALLFRMALSWPEAIFRWRVIKILPKQLLKLGATAIMDRGGVWLTTKSDHVLDLRQLVK